MKRTTPMWLAVLLVLALAAAACGGDDSDDQAQAGSAASDTPADERPTDDSSAGNDTGDETADAGPDQDGSTATDDTESDGEVVRGGEITYAITSDGTGFDTTDAIHAASIRVITAMNDSLVGVDADSNWKPNLAESLAPNDDFTEWTITLRPEVRFHDGVPVDAAAVKANLEAFKAGPNVGFALAPVTEITVVDDLTLLISMNTPWASFPYHLVGQPGWMVSPDTIGSNDTFVGTGPFKMEEWIVGDSVRVVRNDDYWAAGENDLPYLDAITFKAIPEQEARRQALEADDVDVISVPSDATIVDFTDNPAVNIHQGKAAANEALILLNTARAPMDDVRVRRAMAHAIDRQLIIDTFRSGLTEPARSFIDPSSVWSVDTDYPEFDPTTAQALIDEYEAAVGPAELVLTATNVTSTLEVADLVVSLWAEVGIDATVEEIAPGTEVGPVISDAYDAIMWAQFSGVDPDADYQFFHSSGGLLNWTNLVSEEMDAGFDLGRSSGDPAERARGYAMVQEAFADEVPVLWFDHLAAVDVAASAARVHGIGENALPDGSPSIGLLAGHYFGWGEVWIEP